MANFLLKRLIGAAIVLLLTSFFTFELVYLAPGDPASMILMQRLGRLPTDAETTRLAAEYGLDRPPLIQYLDWTSKAVRGDFGRSIRSGDPVVTELRSRLLPTLLLAGGTTLLALAIGLPLGFVAAIRQDSRWDQLARSIALLGVSIPDFWLAFLLILTFSVTLRWLPTHGFDSPNSLILPVVSLSVAHAARVSRLARSNLLTVKFQAYLQTARAKGLSEWLVWVRHALPNIAIPLLTLSVNQFSAIVASSVVIETLFALPGIGQFYVEAVRYNDIPVIQATILLISAALISLNLLTDLAYVLLDPRSRVRSIG